MALSHVLTIIYGGSGDDDKQVEWARQLSLSYQPFGRPEEPFQEPDLAYVSDGEPSQELDLARQYSLANWLYGSDGEPPSQKRDPAGDPTVGGMPLYGFTNVGNSCYRNAVYQFLRPAFQRDGVGKSGDWLQSLYDAKPSRGIVNPPPYPQQAGLDNYFGNTDQQDASQFAYSLLDKPISAAPTLEMNVTNTSTCLHCHKETVVERKGATMMSLELANMGAEGVKKSIETMTKASFDAPEDAVCANCHAQRNTIQCEHYSPTSDCFAVVVDRTADGYRKVHDGVDIPRYVMRNGPEGEEKYEMVSFVEHIGPRMQAGHYVCYLIADNDELWKCDDGIVSAVDRTEEARKALVQAVMVMYRRVNP